MKKSIEVPYQFSFSQVLDFKKGVYTMGDVVVKNKGDALDSRYATDMTEAVSHYLENSKVKSNGVRDVPKAVFVEALETRHGVTKEMLDQVQSAVDFETTAAANVALHDVEQKIGEMSKTDLKDDDARRAISATVRLPTFGGATDVTVSAESYSPIPFRGDGEQQFKTTYGRTQTRIATKGRIDRNFHEEASNRIRKALGVKTDVD